MKTSYILLCISVMALVTYLIRVIPMMLFRKKIENKFIQSFLYYVPYTVLAAMTFPAVFYSTASTVSAIGGCALALILAYCRRGLLTVAIGGAAGAFILSILGL